MPTIKRTPLKTNTPTVSTNKVDSTATTNAIAVSVGKKESEKKKKKTTKEKKENDAAVYNKRLELQCKITKINQLIPKVMDGYCKKQKVSDNSKSKVKDRVTRNYNTRIEHRCIDHGLT
jgi:hypothetical protein